MTNWAKIVISAALATCPTLGAESQPGARDTNALQIQTVTVDGKAVPLHREGKSKLSAYPQGITFGFGSSSNSSRTPIRLRYKLDGYDNAWREHAGVMGLTVRFFDEAGDQVGQILFEISGDSAGWKGGLTNSLLTHRREPIVVPTRASRLWIVVSSAGPPNAVGIYVVDDLVVSKSSPNNGTEVLLRPPLLGPEEKDATNEPPKGWIRDGTHPSMARIIELGQSPVTKAFAVLDDDPTGHAEWHNIKEFAPKVAPGDHLVVEWNELFSVGVGNVRTATYASLPAGDFVFRVAEATAMGAPTGVETSLAIVVPPPFWKEPWFWLVAFLVITVIAMAIARSVTRYRCGRKWCGCNTSRNSNRSGCASPMTSMMTWGRG